MWRQQWQGPELNFSGGNEVLQCRLLAETPDDYSTWTAEIAITLMEPVESTTLIVGDNESVTGLVDVRFRYVPALPWIGRGIWSATLYPAIDPTARLTIASGRIEVTESATVPT